MKEKEYLLTYGKWRAKIEKANFYLMVITFALEIIIYFLLQWKNLISQSLPLYLLRFLVLPTICNLMIVFGGNPLLRRYSHNEDIVNYLSVLQMSLICLVFSLTHYIFSVTLCAFCFPIFITVLFNDKKMTQRFTYLSLIFLFLSLLVRFFDPLAPDYDIYLIPEGVISAVIIISTNIICKIVSEYQKEKNHIIDKIYQSQVVMEERLSRDPKTGLYGSNAFSNELQNMVNNPNARPLTLAIIDIDNFKKVNDNYGHANGDKVICRLAGLMLGNALEDIFPARFGGEEFAVIFRKDMEESSEWVEKLRSEFASQKYDFTFNRVTISIGIAEWTPTWSDNELFTNADTAMYCSKQNGKNIVTRYSETFMNRPRQKKRALG
ncbi:MAG: GGDEF domain-containing protein [Clostridium sp.]